MFFLVQYTYMKNTFESSRFFPHIAWTIVICFALFTYTLTIRLERDISYIDSDVNTLSERISVLEAQQNNSAE